MKVCSVCGKEYYNLGSEIIEGVGRELVCKKCLEKAGVSVTFFTYQKISAKQIKETIDHRQIDIIDSTKPISDTNYYFDNHIHYRKKKKTIDKVATTLTIIALVLSTTLAAYCTFAVVLEVDNRKESNNSESTNEEINVEKNILGDVSITIPKSYSMDMTDTTLTDEQKEMGVSKIVKNSDGSITMKIKRSKYKDFLENYRKTTAESITTPINDGTYKTIKSVDYNKDLSKITLNVDKTEYENSFESMAIMSYGLAGMLYQTFDVDAPKKVTVNVVDEKTKEVISTTVYPDALENE